MGWWKPGMPPTPAAPTSRAIGVVVHDPQGTPVVGAVVILDDRPTPHTGVAGEAGYCELTPVPKSLTASQLEVQAEGYQPYSVHVDLAANIDQQVWVGGDPQQPTAILCPPLQPAWAPPAPEPRAPLPPFDQGYYDTEFNEYLPVRTEIPYPVPAGRDIRFWRGNAWSLTVPGGLPVIPGGPRDPSQLCTYLADLYPQADLARGLDAYCRAGYTHWTSSWPDARARGLSIAQFVDLLRFVKRWGLWHDVHFFSKDYDPADPYIESVYPVIDALMDAGVLDIGTFAWEAPLFISPEHYEPLTNQLAARAPSISWYHHFTPHYCSYPREASTGDTSHAFWERQPANVRGLKYQCVADAPDQWQPGMMQARINDGLVRLIQGGLWGLSRTFDLVAWETVALLTWRGALDEAHGDLRGYESLCSPGPMPVMGYGNGARRPDGRPL